MTIFLGRGEELVNFRTVLASLHGAGLPDEAYVVVVHGLGGIGKSTLLKRYAEMAAGDDVATGVGGNRGLTVAWIDWESEQRVRAADFALDGGPPIWITLDRIYQALSEAVAGSKRDTAFLEKAFGPFRFQVTRVNIHPIYSG